MKYIGKYVPSYAWVCYLAGWSEPVSCERIVKPACYVMEERKTKGCYKDLLLSYTQNKLNCIVFYISLSFIMCIGIMVINVIYKAEFFSLLLYCLSNLKLLMKICSLLYTFPFELFLQSRFDCRHFWLSSSVCHIW